MSVIHNIIYQHVEEAAFLWLLLLMGLDLALCMAGSMRSPYGI